MSSDIVMKVVYPMGYLSNREDMCHMHNQILEGNGGTKIRRLPLKFIIILSYYITFL